MVFMAYSKASLYKKLAGSFKVSLFLDFTTSTGIRSGRALKVLTVYFETPLAEIIV